MIFSVAPLDGKSELGESEFPVLVNRPYLSGTVAWGSNQVPTVPLSRDMGQRGQLRDSKLLITVRAIPVDTHVFSVLRTVGTVNYS
ncbi:hypothetical protein D3C76_1708990 [compost metagenome]